MDQDISKLRRELKTNPEDPLVRQKLITTLTRAGLINPEKFAAKRARLADRMSKFREKYDEPLDMERSSLVMGPGGTTHSRMIINHLKNLYPDAESMPKTVADKLSHHQNALKNNKRALRTLNKLKQFYRAGSGYQDPYSNTSYLTYQGFRRRAQDAHKAGLASKPE